MHLRKTITNISHQPLYVYVCSHTTSQVEQKTISLTFASIVIVQLRNLHRPHLRPPPDHHHQHDDNFYPNHKTTSSKTKQERPEDSYATSSRHDSSSSDQRRDLDALLAGMSSSQDSDHLIAALQGSGDWRDPANTKRKRRSHRSGVGVSLSGRFGTILEEDDDSL